MQINQLNSDDRHLEFGFYSAIRIRQSAIPNSQLPPTGHSSVTKRYQAYQGRKYFAPGDRKILNLLGKSAKNTRSNPLKICQFNAQNNPIQPAYRNLVGGNPQLTAPKLLGEGGSLITQLSTHPTLNRDDTLDPPPTQLTYSLPAIGMSFKLFPKQQGVQLLQRSLARGRLGHAYLFSGDQLEELESLARTLAKTLNCQNPVKENGAAMDCCDECASCRKIDNDTHADIHWARPESKSRIVSVEQMRELMREIQLKPAEAQFKVAVIVAADRLNIQAANAFLKTLEEPPQKSILVLLSTEPSRLLETIISRCLRVNFAGDSRRELDPAESAWLEKFSALAGEQKTLLGRYNLADIIMQKLGEIRASVEETLTARSPLQKYDDVEKDLREKWEDELDAAVEAEYRRRRAELLLLVQCWLRDVWLHTLAAGKELLNFPKISGGEAVARKISPRQALENLQTLEETQRLLHTNVQEALALEVGLLKLHF